jgi:ankyrin repeat protein
MCLYPHSLQLLLQNARDGAQLTMLHLGCREGKYDVAQLLLASGAEVDSKVQLNTTTSMNYMQ